MVINVYFKTEQEHDEFVKHLRRSFNIIKDEQLHTKSANAVLYRLEVEPYHSTGRKRKLDEDDLERIIFERQCGKSYDKIAKEFGVGKNTIIRAIKREEKGEK